HGRQQSNQRAIVGVPAAIGLGRQVLGDGNLGSEFGFLSGDLPGGDEFAQDFLRRRREELSRDFYARYLRNDSVWRDNSAIRAASQTGRSKPYDGRREIEIGRRFDKPHAASQVEIDGRRLMARLIGRVNEVEAEFGWWGGWV